MTTADLALESPTRRAGEDVFAWTVFPLAMFGSIGVAIAMLNAGANPLLAFALPLLLGYAIVIAGERLYPHVADWSRNHGDVRTDAAWFASILATVSIRSRNSRTPAISSAIFSSVFTCTRAASSTGS